MTTETCGEFLKTSQGFDDYSKDEMRNGITELEMATGRKFCPTKDPEHKPLLLSVRSASPVSMPGMLTSILNVGMNDAVADKFIQQTHNRKWVYDTYRRFLQMFGEIVLGVDGNLYQNILTRYLSTHAGAHAGELSEKELQEIVQEFKKIIYIPDDPWTQLFMCIESALLSWNSPKAVKYRDLNNIPNDMGTAVIVQTMVFGNLNNLSGSGFAFTRNPATGERGIFGEYLPNAEGEDVVAGFRAPMVIEELHHRQPSVYDALCEAIETLEAHYRDMQVRICSHFGCSSVTTTIGCRIHR